MDWEAVFMPAYERVSICPREELCPAANQVRAGMERALSLIGQMPEEVRLNALRTLARRVARCARVVCVRAQDHHDRLRPPARQRDYDEHSLRVSAGVDLPLVLGDAIEQQFGHGEAYSRLCLNLWECGVELGQRGALRAQTSSRLERCRVKLWQGRPELRDREQLRQHLERVETELRWLQRGERPVRLRLVSAAAVCVLALVLLVLGRPVLSGAAWLVAAILGWPGVRSAGGAERQRRERTAQHIRELQDYRAVLMESLEETA